MTCRECEHKQLGYFPSKPNSYVCVGTREPFVIDNLDAECQTGFAKSYQRGVIKDSGDRTEFSTGAVRDMREGKGRCDLMPLEVVSDICSHCSNDATKIFDNIALFMREKDTAYLNIAICCFADQAYQGSVYTMLLEVAKHFEEGAKKYGESNWQKGIPIKCYIDSAIRHYIKWVRGDKDEPHNRAFCWNLMCCIWEVDYSPRANKEEN